MVLVLPRYTVGFGVLSGGPLHRKLALLARFSRAHPLGLASEGLGSGSIFGKCIW